MTDNNINDVIKPESLHDRVEKRMIAMLFKQKMDGKVFISDQEIDDLCDRILNEEIEQKTMQLFEVRIGTCYKSNYSQVGRCENFMVLAGDEKEVKAKVRAAYKSNTYMLSSFIFINKYTDKNFLI